MNHPETESLRSVAVATAADDAGVDPRQLASTFWPSLTTTERPRAVVLVQPEMPRPDDALVHALRVDGFAVAWWNAEASKAGGAAGPLTISAAASALDALIRQLSHHHGVALGDLSVAAQGDEALAALTWAHDYAPRVRSVIAASHGLLTDTESPRAMEDDGACAKRVAQDAPAIDVPILLLVADGTDPGFRAAAEAIVKGSQARPTALAVVGGDASDPSVRETARTTLCAFLRDGCRRPVERPSLLDAHERGFTKDELDAYLRPLPLLSKRRMQFALANVSMRTLGRLSRGMRLGLTTGFDSGSTMEYVYANVPSGITALGRSIDASFLSGPGWVAIRVRRRNVQRLIAETARRIQAERRELHVLDIAAGHGRYVVEALLELGRRPESLRLQEYVDLNVQRGRALLQERGLADIGTFVRGDAFDGAALAAVRPRPTLTIACGIYELFADNALVITSLLGLSAAMEHGSFLLYTNQPWQPMLEFFVRVVPSHRDGEPCVVRRRTQAEMDQLVEFAGFTKVSQVTDPQGIFTVSIARKRGADSNGPLR